MQWWCHHEYHLESYRWELFIFTIRRFFGTSNGVINDEEEIIEVEVGPTEHMESSVGENQRHVYSWMLLAKDG